MYFNHSFFFLWLNGEVLIGLTKSYKIKSVLSVHEQMVSKFFGCLKEAKKVSGCFFENSY
jgi:hypothetical protein